MRLRLVVVGGALVAGCQAPRAIPDERGAQVRPETTIGPVRAITREEVEREQRAGTTVDTIVVATTHLEMRPGETYSLLNLAPVARDRAGQPVAGFAATFIRHTNDIYEISFITLRALRPGVDTLYVEALPREPSKDRVPRRPSTRVTVTVRP